jgi:hypothetical protein
VVLPYFFATGPVVKVYPGDGATVIIAHPLKIPGPAEQLVAALLLANALPTTVFVVAPHSAWEGIIRMSCVASFMLPAAPPTQFTLDTTLIVPAT